MSNKTFTISIWALYKVYKIDMPNFQKGIIEKFLSARSSNWPLQFQINQDANLQILFITNKWSLDKVAKLVWSITTPNQCKNLEDKSGVHHGFHFARCLYLIKLKIQLFRLYYFSSSKCYYTKYWIIVDLNEIYYVSFLDLLINLRKKITSNIGQIKMLKYNLSIGPYLALGP